MPLKPARLAQRALSLLAFSSLLFLLAATAGATEPVNKTFFGDIAIKGYDAVAYHQEGKPVEGNKKISHDWNGANWLFASNANRDLFKSEPEKYAPQYGGYCAWAVSQGYTANIDPEAWSIVDDKLYLNYSRKIQAKWEAKRQESIRDADANWPKLLAED